MRKLNRPTPSDRNRSERFFENLAKIVAVKDAYELIIVAIQFSNILDADILQSLRETFPNDGFDNLYLILILIIRRLIK
jgi:hypothetical protein